MGIISSSSFAIPSAKEGTSSEIAMTSPQNGKKRARSPTPTKGRTAAAARPPAVRREDPRRRCTDTRAQKADGRTGGRPPRPLPENGGCYCADRERRTRRTDGPASVEEGTEEGQQQCRCAFCSFSNGEGCDFAELGRSFGPCQRPKGHVTAST